MPALRGALRRPSPLRHMRAFIPGRLRFLRPRPRGPARRPAPGLGLLPRLRALRRRMRPIPGRTLPTLHGGVPELCRAVPRHRRRGRPGPGRRGLHPRHRRPAMVRDRRARPWDAPGDSRVVRSGSPGDPGPWRITTRMASGLPFGPHRPMLSHDAALALEQPGRRGDGARDRIAVRRPERTRVGCQVQERGEIRPAGDPPFAVGQLGDQVGALRCDRPRRRTVALRASVGSTEAS